MWNSKYLFRLNFNFSSNSSFKSHFFEFLFILAFLNVHSLLHLIPFHVFLLRFTLLSFLLFLFFFLDEGFESQRRKNEQEKREGRQNGAGGENN